MPLHLGELRKHTEQNAKIIELLEKLTETQQPKKEVVSDKPNQPRGRKKS